jgi:hypothetical protein
MIQISVKVSQKWLRLVSGILCGVILPQHFSGLPSLFHFTMGRMIDDGSS